MSGQDVLPEIEAAEEETAGVQARPVVLAIAAALIAVTAAIVFLAGTSS